MGQDSEMCAISRSTQRHRTLLTALLVTLCIPIFFYHLVPSFTHAADAVLADLSSHILGQTSRSDFCTKEIGDAHCCALYLDAAPCIDECRNQHVDRETLTLTLEYDQCADLCLAKYNDNCRRAGNGNSLKANLRNS